MPSIAFVDIRDFSSDWTMTCPTHGSVTSAIRFDESWESAYCSECFHAWLAAHLTIQQVQVTANPGAPEPLSVED